MRPIRSLLLAAAAFAVLLAFAPGAMAHSWKGDRNHDRIPDRWERSNHLSLKVDQARRDQDHDGLRNRGEFLAGDNPRKADTDDDGIMDGRERAGTVTSFTDSVLVVHLFNGGDVKGTVDADTEIKCEDAQPLARTADDGPGGGDDHGDDDQGDHDRGDDNDDDQGREACDASALVPGAIVGEAELRATAGGLVFREIELVG